MVLLFLLMSHIPIRDRNISIHSTAATLSALLCHMRQALISLLCSAICKCCQVMLMVYIDAYGFLQFCAFQMDRINGFIVSFDNGFIVSFVVPYSHQRQKPMHSFNSSSIVCPSEIETYAFIQQQQHCLLCSAI